MIAVYDVEVNAANPALPLREANAYVGSPLAVFVRKVPQAVGSWRITSVQITAAYPDNTIASVECVCEGSLWIGTISASAAPGRSTQGFTIAASGVDENGERVTGYVLGVGDIKILDRDSTITPGETTYYAHLLDTIPATPHKGDLANFDGVYKLFDGSAWISLGADVAREYAEAAQAAKTAAETAQGKAEAAETGAVNAKADAVAAKTAAKTAQGKAELAETGAVNAKADAVAAKTAAETAQGKAELAETGAVAAKGSAESAAGDARASKTTAQAAQQAAEAARDRAEAAANYVVNWDPELNVPYIYVPAE